MVLPLDVENRRLQVALFVVQQLFPYGTLRPFTGHKPVRSMAVLFESLDAFQTVVAD